VRFPWIVGSLLAAGLGAGAALPPVAAVGQTSTESTWDLSGGDAGRGRQIFANNGCGWCHEASGTASGRGPPLAGTKRNDEFLATRILNGLQGRMPAFGGSFEEDQIKDLIAFIRSLQPENAP
jgi:mono/diheme cytochrome c family protein